MVEVIIPNKTENRPLSSYPFSSFAEYLRDSSYIDAEFALGMVDRTAFAAFNNTPNSDSCLEITVPCRRAVTDTQAQAIIHKISRCNSVTEFQCLETIKKERFIKKIYDKGVSVRQLSRLTGTSKGMVEKWLKS